MDCGPFEYVQSFTPRPVLATIDAVFAVSRFCEEVIRKMYVVLSLICFNGCVGARRLFVAAEHLSRRQRGG